MYFCTVEAIGPFWVITWGMLCFGGLDVNSAGTACSPSFELILYLCWWSFNQKSQVNNALYTCVINKNFLASKMKQNACLTDIDLSYWFFCVTYRRVILSWICLIVIINTEEAKLHLVLGNEGWRQYIQFLSDLCNNGVRWFWTEDSEEQSKKTRMQLPLWWGERRVVQFFCL